MKRLNFAIVIVVLSMLCAVLFTSCGKEKYELDEFAVNGFELQNIQGDDFTFRFLIKNQKDEKRTFDSRKITLKIDGDDKKTIGFMGGTEEISGKSEKSISYLVMFDHPKMKVDDTVKIYYDDKEVCEIKVTELGLDSQT